MNIEELEQRAAEYARIAYSDINKASLSMAFRDGFIAALKWMPVTKKMPTEEEIKKNVHREYLVKGNYPYEDEEIIVDKIDIYELANRGVIRFEDADFIATHWKYIDLEK